MKTDRKIFYKSVVESNNKEKDYLDTKFTSMNFERYTQFTVPQYCEHKLYLVSFIHYGTVDLWWLIAEINDMIDPIGETVMGKILKIPDISDFYDFYNVNSIRETITDKFSQRTLT